MPLFIYTGCRSYLCRKTCIRRAAEHPVVYKQLKLVWFFYSRCHLIDYGVYDNSTKPLAGFDCTTTEVEK